ncbi:universal stress protein [Hyphococcus sp.]|uniref:universal stress protein n=1 Tax=Hyphococcus sp. TaxID=2038636 RepID=UPI0035C6FCF2
MPQDAPFAVKKIILPVDMDHKEQSARALDAAAQLAKACDAKLYVMTSAHPLGDDIAEYPEHHKPEFEKYIKAAAERHDVAVESMFRHHESAEKMILEAAEETGADLIVMGTHDPKLTDHLFGSHASHIALHAPCSVMVVR